MKTSTKNDILDWALYIMIVACIAWFLYGLFEIGCMAVKIIGRMV